jgi:hypothetical protein
MSTIAPQLKIGTGVSISSTRLNLAGVQATVTRLNVLSVPDSLFCETSDGEQYGFFGDEIDECITIISQP